MQQQAGLHEQALNKAAELGIASQLDEVEQLRVAVQADPFKLVTGEVDAVAIEGEGLVMNQDLRVERLEMQMGPIAINPLQVAFGQIELTKPTAGSACVVLTEADINRAFNSEYISSMLQNLPVRADSQTVTLDTQQVEFRLPGEGKVTLSAQVLLRETSQTQQVSLTATPRVGPRGEGVVLEDVQYAGGKELSPELTAALLEKAAEILDFSNFDLEGMSLRIQQLDVGACKLTLHARAHALANSHSLAGRLLKKDFLPCRAGPYPPPTGLLTGNQ
ncbi:LmeA family phospholipid-binding protein [Kamptonema formosum]|uniref:LmeA family phospholipid-binding protein n=1 Tax=Kamptonema formosum TaxID=331992 RepID=UPI00034AE5AE|nr:DUF2993 domain-containing protein [Oscillatoria sp. PCC 10802]